MRTCRRRLSEERFPLGDSRGLGCRDGEHKAWIIIEAGDKNEARQVVPPAFRASARITGLNKFTVEEIDTILGEHRT